MTQTKACTKCALVTPLDGFHKKAVAKDGLMSECKVCANARRRAYHAANSSAGNAYSREYKANHRDEIAAYNRSYAVAHKAEIAAYNRGYNASHKEEKAAYNRAYHADNRAAMNAKSLAYVATHADRLNAYNREYRATHKDEATAYRRAHQRANPEVYVKNNQRRRASKLGNGVFDITNKEIARMRMLPCVHCGGTGNIHIDHVIPLSKGGRHSVGNLQPLCANCNISKRDSFYVIFKIRQSKNRMSTTEMRGL